MAFPDLLETLGDWTSEIKGRLQSNFSLAPYTWFRVGGAAQLLFNPADEADLAFFLKNLPADIPVTVIGLGSNLLVREGGVEGVVIRLSGKSFSAIEVDGNYKVHVGAAMPDMRFATQMAKQGIAGFAFYKGIPGSIGGALRMNAGAHGAETKERLISARAVDRQGNVHILTPEDLKHEYRSCGVPADFIFTQATYQGEAGDPNELKTEMDEVSTYREENQPTKERTGGSTFKNPDGLSAWKLVDEAGFRGFELGGAQVSPKHTNFLINTGDATAEDIERLGEMVRGKVRKQTGLELHWEIKRIGCHAEGVSIPEFLEDGEA
ncbi:UDP-N-acetylmuramate dehydrogenase [Cohaesibacter gelatinilyticus]|uniref:UDP-N-acetylenolpyruvoylglucosamine reductase n=1 Tax=Cohaesibacter gelatinilyticus TaxID=372072 RepID=A0A285NN58_9HYPH|nr:UDP-N-acetylmuramate dehydrogenase [Cohaesibacter gelatinilyticus]SNZ09061.1 UDP-N-acetylmuramate dehydrogenase [Cohaesibacter gelatinilyticus]